MEARDLLGIHFDDNESLHRDGYLVALPCPSHLETRQDDPLIPAAPPYLPAGAYLPETAPGLEPLPNPGAIACPETGRYLSAWRYYNFEYPGSGPPPALNIIHWFEERPYFQINSWEWIRVASLAGHDVIEVLNYQVIVPTDDGYMLFESQTGFPYEEVLKVAASYLSGTASPGPS